MMDAHKGCAMLHAMPQSDIALWNMLHNSAQRTAARSSVFEISSKQAVAQTLPMLRIEMASRLQRDSFG